jgi:hypothetical protein
MPLPPISLGFWLDALHQCRMETLAFDEMEDWQVNLIEPVINVKFVSGQAIASCWCACWLLVVVFDQPRARRGGKSKNPTNMPSLELLSLISGGSVLSRWAVPFVFCLPLSFRRARLDRLGHIVPEVGPTGACGRLARTEYESEGHIANGKRFSTVSRRRGSGPKRWTGLLSLPAPKRVFVHRSK